MKPDVERIFTKLASQKVELAKKPSDILKALQNLEEQSEKIGETMYENRTNYNIKLRKLYERLLKIDDRVYAQKGFLDQIEYAVKELGIKTSAVAGYDKAKSKLKGFQSASSYQSQFREI
jgi:negative regulator of replication initiation|tara:strand:- start:43 stop:402 length:360 start_codon:yes stop_codon:yes gene_type:complete